MTLLVDGAPSDVSHIILLVNLLLVNIWMNHRRVIGKIKC